MATSIALRWSLGIALVALTSSCGSDPEPAPQPHILLISIDTLRADRLGCYGNPSDTSPGLDALAASGWLYEQAFAHSNATAPSHMSLFTGVLPEVHGIFHDTETALSPGIPTITEQFSRAGWRTVGFADGGFVIASLGFDRGFDFFHSKYQPLQKKLKNIASFIERADDQPTFLFVHTYGVHAPYVPAQEHDIFTDKAYRGEVYQRLRAVRSRQAQPWNPKLGPLRTFFWHDRRDFTDEDLQYLSDLYDGCIRTVDAGITELLEALDRKGWLENTWIVVMSDHGEAFKEHGTYSHHQLYSEELHVPLIIRPPGGLEQGVTVDSMVGLVDVTATLLDIAGIDKPPMVQGSSLFPIEQFTRHSIHSTNNEAQHSHSLTSNKHKLLQRLGRNVDELYDRKQDPAELDNLLNSEDTPERMTSLRAALRAEARRSRMESAGIRARVGEPLPAGDLSPEQLDTLRALGYIK
jgi:arylsulfatase A-like enzyme